MPSSVSQGSENSPEPSDELENLDSQITSKRKQIAALQSELAQLEQRQRELNRRQQARGLIPPSLPADAEIKEQDSLPSVWRRLFLATIAFLLAGLGQRALHLPLHIGGRDISGWVLYGIAAILFVIAFGRVRSAQLAR